MEQASIISDLLKWLENHLDQPLSLDHVAAKAGYSKWHLQRMFKDVTGHAIGAHIRTRRLTKAAVALRLTSRPILDIALQYRFDSQQTFTRAFKKQFKQTPAFYRRAEDWHSFGICAPFRLDNYPIPPAEFVTLQEQHLVGLTQCYSCTLEQISTCRTELRSHFWRQYLGGADTVPPILYDLHHSRPSKEKEDEQEVFYTTAIEPQHVPRNVQPGQPIILQGGEYVQFSYEGTAEGLQDFILTLYVICLPRLNLTRRKGYDIERFFPQGRPQDRPLPIIKCEYLIPIRS